MKFLAQILLLIIIDFCLIGIWVRTMDLDLSVSIFILVLIPFVIVLNLLIAGVLYYVRKQYSKFFLINTVISAVIMNYLFGEGISRHQTDRLESWEFTHGDKRYQITHWKPEDEFSMSERLDPGSSTVFLEGRFTEANNEVYLTTDSTKYVIRNGVLYGFGNESKGFMLKKIDP